MTDQRLRMDAGHRATMTVLETFDEIQNGPNPLTRAELQALIDKRPERYGVLQGMAESPAHYPGRRDACRVCGAQLPRLGNLYCSANCEERDA